MGDEPRSQEQIIAIGRELIEHLNANRSPLTVTRERVVNMAHGPMVYGLANHALRLGAVVLDLHEDGKALEAMPLVRSLYEAGLTAQWLAQSREAPGVGGGNLWDLRCSANWRSIGPPLLALAQVRQLRGDHRPLRLGEVAAVDVVTDGRDVQRGHP